MKRFGLFYCQALSFALPLEQLDKIVQGVSLFKLPLLPSSVPAVLVDNREIVPVLHPVDKKGMAAAGVEGFPCYAIVKTDAGRLALPVSQVNRIVSELKGTYESFPENPNLRVAGVFTYGNGKFDILNIEYLAREMTQGFRRSLSETDAARRHQ